VSINRTINRTLLMWDLFPALEGAVASICAEMFSLNIEADVGKYEWFVIRGEVDAWVRTPDLTGRMLVDDEEWQLLTDG